MAAFNYSISAFDGIAFQHGIYVGDGYVNTKVINSLGNFVGSSTFSGSVSVRSVTASQSLTVGLSSSSYQNSMKGSWIGKLALLIQNTDGTDVNSGGLDVVVQPTTGTQDILGLYNNAGATRVFQTSFAGLTSIGKSGETSSHTVNGGLIITQGLTVSTTVAVLGAATFKSNASVSGTLSVKGATTLKAALTVSTTLAVAGATTLASLSTSGAAVFKTTATVSSTLIVAGATTLKSTLTVSSTLGVTGATTLSSLSTTGAAVFKTTVTVSQTLVVAGITTLKSNLTVSGSLTVAGAATFGSTQASYQHVFKGSYANKIGVLVWNTDTGTGSGGLVVASSRAAGGSSDLLSAYVNSASTAVFKVDTAGLVTIGTGSSTIHRLNTTVATTAATGTVTLPATAVGYITLNINGTNRKVPYYA